MSGNRVLGHRLYQGSFDASRYMRKTPSLHIHCAGETSPDFVGSSNLWLRIDDVPTAWQYDRDWQRRVLAAAHAAAKVLARGGTVLTTCFMGLNRSGLVSALAMIEIGIPADEAIRFVRQARGDHALGNESFVEFIQRVGRSA